jgi:hypothetical protein
MRYRFLLVVPLTLTATVALADPIYLYGVSQADLTFSAVGNSNNVKVQTNGISGAASYLADTGVFTLGPAKFVAGPLQNNIFPTDAAQSFIYQANDEVDGNGVSPDGIKGTITWARVEADGLAAEPILFGYLGLSSVTGDTPFMMNFPPGGLAQVELYFPTDCSLSALINDGCPATMQVASFEGGTVTHILRTNVPEPGGIAWIYALAGLVPMAKRPRG